MVSKKYVTLVFLLLSLCAYSQSDTLRIFSWNIFMVPPVIFKSDQLNRSQMIAGVLKKTDADIIILQEAFMKKSRRIIENKLKSVYPHHTGKPKGGGLFKMNSGVWILSKYPIQDVAFTKFKDCKGSDCLGGKGAYRFVVEKNGRKLFFVGTHVQSGPQPAVRVEQFEQLADDTKYISSEVPVFFVGDLNTNKYSPDEYLMMLNTLQAKDGLTEGEKYTYAADNDLAKRFFGESGSTLDYVLVRDTEENILSIRRIIHKFTSVSFGTFKFNDLSDHYAVSAEVVFK